MDRLLLLSVVAVTWPWWGPVLREIVAEIRAVAESDGEETLHSRRARLQGPTRVRAQSSYLAGMKGEPEDGPTWSTSIPRERKRRTRRDRTAEGRGFRD
ncbi:MAG: hypothetical protein AAF682_24100 [Planctomycetota bacterium]